MRNANKNLSNLHYKKNKKQSIKIKYLLLVLITVSALIIARNLSIDKPKPTSAVDTDTTTTKQIKYEPPSEGEKQEAEQQKEEIVNKQPSILSSSSDGRKVVVPIVASATESAVSAYVNNIFEEGGICTAYFIKGDTTVTGTSVAFGNASYTSCQPISPSIPLPSKGGWSVSISYSSQKYSGKSTTYKVDE